MGICREGYIYIYIKIFFIWIFGPRDLFRWIRVENSCLSAIILWKMDAYVSENSLGHIFGQMGQPQPGPNYFKKVPGRARSQLFFKRARPSQVPTIFKRARPNQVPIIWLKGQVRTSSRLFFKRARPNQVPIIFKRARPNQVPTIFKMFQARRSQLFFKMFQARRSQLF